MKTITPGLLASAAAAACLAGPAYSQSLSGEYHLEIKRQPLSAALTEFSKQTGLQIGYFPETLAQNILIGPLSGRYTAESAITQLLVPIGLSFERLNERTIAVTEPRAAKVQRRGFSTIQRMTDYRAVPSFMRLANLRLAEVPATEENDKESRAETNTEDADNTKGRRRSIEEVIVTAQKRAERLQDVPVSITAITAEDIDRRGLVSQGDYLRGIPGVNQVNDYGGGAVVIRGVETRLHEQNSPGSSPSVATYFGETPTTTTAGRAGNSSVDIKLVDIERIEVLRGPQGTAFGSSSLGGAIRTIPIAPKLDHYEGSVTANYSVTSGAGDGNQMLQAVGNFPLAREKLGVRASAYQHKDSGFYRSVAGSNPAFQARAAGFGAQAFTKDADEVGASEFTGGRVATLFQPTDKMKFTLTYLTQHTEIEGDSIATSGRYEQTLYELAPEHVRDGRTLGVFDSDIDLGNLTVEYSLGWADLLGTYSHVESGGVSAVSFPHFGSPLPLSFMSVTDRTEKSGELRLSSRLSGPWNILAGLYTESKSEDTDFTYYWLGDTQLSPFGNTRLAGFSFADNRKVEQDAAFGEVSWKFLPRFTLTGGVRAYRYSVFTGDGTAGGVLITGAGGRTTTSPGLVSSEVSGEIFRGNFSYKPNDNALLYASWGEGFRLGTPPVPNGGLSASACDTNNDGIVDGTSVPLASTNGLEDDMVDNLELGGKFELLDGRLKIAADVYRINWTGLPIRQTAPICLFSYTVSAGEARSEGLELEASYYVTDALRVDVSGSRINARLTKDSPGIGLKDDRLPGSAKYNANLGLQYHFAIARHDAYVRADSIYVGPFYGNLASSPQTEAGDYVKVDASARVSIRNLSVELFVRNLTDADAYTWRGNSPRGAYYGYLLRPRTIGLQLGYSFE